MLRPPLVLLVTVAATRAVGRIVDQALRRIFHLSDDAGAPRPGRGAGRCVKRGEAAGAGAPEPTRYKTLVIVRCGIPASSYTGPSATYPSRS